MFPHFELTVQRPNYEEYEIYLPAGVPRTISSAFDIDGSGRQQYQEVGFLIISRGASGPADNSADRITLGLHPDLTDEERWQLFSRVEGLCGKHVSKIGAEFAPMTVLREQLGESSRR